MNTRHGEIGEPGGQAGKAMLLLDSESARASARDQLERILASPAFHNSRRYASVLRFIVDQTLKGDGDHLKERNIGIEVFHRLPDYDTTTDHVARSAVTEIRKKLAQYYLQCDRRELRIEIPSGSYTPQFRWPGESTELPAARTAEQIVPEAERLLPPPRAHASRRHAVWIGIGCALLAGAIVAFAIKTMRAPDALSAFWAPLFASRTPILLCIGNVEGGETPPAANAGLNPNLTLSEFHNAPVSTVNEYDAFTLAKLAGLMRAHGKALRYASQSSATFTDLQRGPTILIGLLNNNWTERLIPTLRFTVERPTPSKVIIRDRENPSNTSWSIDYSAPYLSIARDYALVLRMVDPQTEQPMVVVAGITVFGTSAAGNFITNEDQIRKLAAMAPRGWKKKNMEIVLSTDVIGGRSGPASVVAAQFW